MEAESGDVADKSDTSSVPPTPEKSPRKPKKSRMLAELEVDLDAAKVDEPEETGRAVRTSRRIAQIRLKVSLAMSSPSRLVRSTWIK